MIEVLKQALEALEDYRSGCQTKYDADKAITSLRQAIADAEKQEVERQVDAHAKELREMYLTPQRQPLTDKQIEAMWLGSVGFLNPILNQQTRTAFARAIEAAHGIKD